MDRFTTLIICGTCILTLWAGVRKANRAGIYRTSDGYKKIEYVMEMTNTIETLPDNNITKNYTLRQ